jgi:nucleoside 2-deoxyribosyltransferase
MCLKRRDRRRASSRRTRGLPAPGSGTRQDAAGIFATDVGGIDWAEALVAIMDGPDPDSGTAWECGYAYGKKPVILVRTDIRAQAGRSGPYNPMLAGSATDRLDLPGAAKPDLIRAVLQALANVEEMR